MIFFRFLFTLHYLSKTTTTIFYNENVANLNLKTPIFSFFLHIFIAFLLKEIDFLKKIIFVCLSTENNCFFHEIHARFKLNFCVERKMFKTGASLRYIYYIHTFYLRKNCYNKTNDKIDILFLVMLRIIPEKSAQKCLFSSKSQVEQGFSLFFVKK